jgi:8-oxo-dGTP diphosphatase
MRKAVRAIIINADQILVMHRNKFGQQYYNLVGGGIDFGENAEQALFREVKEESGIVFKDPKLVVIQEAGDMYGTQYTYLCEYVSGEPKLADDSIEASINTLGKNLYKPMWLPLEDFEKVPFVADILRNAVVDGIKNGFPDEPIILKGM